MTETRDDQADTPEAAAADPAPASELDKLAAEGLGDPSEAEAEAAEREAAAGDLDPGLAYTDDGAVVMGFDLWFRQVWCGSFQVAAGVTRLDALAPLDGPNEAIEREAARAVYDTALEIEWLRFLIGTDNKWAARALAVGTLVAVKARPVVDQVREKRRAKVEAAKAARQPANDDDRPAAQAANDDPPRPSSPESWQDSYRQ